MTDIEWIKEVRRYAVHFGQYDFSHEEMKRMRPYVKHLPLPLQGVQRWVVKLTHVWDLMDEMERGIAEAVAAKLTQ